MKIKFFLILLGLCFEIRAQQIDINSATLEQLDQMTGIGPVMAQRIIDARPFSSVDDLLKVKGIGAKTLQKIKRDGQNDSHNAHDDQYYHQSKPTHQIFWCVGKSSICF